MPAGMIAPAFSVYARDEYQRTAHLTPDQFAAHWRAILWSWTEGPLPLNDSQRRQVCKVEGARAFKVIWGGIAPLWSIGTDGWRHEPLEEKRTTASAFYKAQHEKAILGGQARAAKRAAAVYPDNLSQWAAGGQPSGLPDSPPERMPDSTPEVRPIAALSSSSSDQDQDLKKEQERADGGGSAIAWHPGSLAEQVGDAFLVKLALNVIDDNARRPDGKELAVSEAIEELKRAAVAYNVPYAGLPALESALGAAARQRASEAPSDAALRVARMAIQPGDGFVTRDEFNSRVWKTVEGLWPSPRFAVWRGQVSALMYRDEWIRSLPHVFDTKPANHGFSHIAIKGSPIGGVRHA